MKRFFTISGLMLLFLFSYDAAFAQNVTVKGKITDNANGQALIGVTVSVKGTAAGTQTDVNGAYSISAPGNATLKFAYIGYASQEIPVSGQTTINVSMLPQTNELQQIVVIGYGTQRKLDVTGSITTVKGADVAKQASPNAVSGLQGNE